MYMRLLQASREYCMNSDSKNTRRLTDKTSVLVQN